MAGPQSEAWVLFSRTSTVTIAQAPSGRYVLPSVTPWHGSRRPAAESHSIPELVQKTSEIRAENFGYQKSWF